MHACGWVGACVSAGEMDGAKNRQRQMKAVLINDLSLRHLQEGFIITFCVHFYIQKGNRLCISTLSAASLTFDWLPLKKT